MVVSLKIFYFLDNLEQEKTLFSAKLALESGMDFAIMSGPSFDQFKPQDAIIEIKNLFKWANNSKKGILLFVDEADSFLEDRSTIHPNRIPVLNEWINQTGTESRKFMCVYETNRPECLDPAVQSRITQSIEFIAPSHQEILRMLVQYIDQYIVKDLGRRRNTGFLSRWFPFLFGGKLLHINADALIPRLEAIAVYLANKNFVGRDVTNLVIALSQAAYASPDLKLTDELVDLVVEQQITKKETEKKYLANLASRIDDHRKRLVDFR